MAREFSSLKQMDTPVKVLFSGYLTTVAVGYLFALIQILFTHGMADGKFGLSIDDIVYSYYGNRSGTLLETKLNGSMKDNASEQERFAIIQWIRDGAEESDYRSEGIAEIFTNRCIMCHNKNAGGLPDFTKFEEIARITEQDEGATFSSLTRVSHIHLFGISFIFMFVGLIFSFSETSTVKYKCIAIGMPYIFLLVDILSWWLTKLHPMFAWLVILAGGGMAVAFGFMWLVSLLEMWAFEKVFLNAKGEPYPPLSTYVEPWLVRIGCSSTGNLLNKTWCFTKSSIVYIWRQMFEKATPVIKKLISKELESSNKSE